MEWKKDGSGSIWRMNKEKLIFVFCSGLLLFVLSMPGTEKERSLEAAAVGSGGMENMDRSGTGRLLDGPADGPEKGELPGLSGGAQAVSGGSGGSLYEKELEQLGVQPLVMKGIVCRSLYPKPDLRPSGDEDLLIPEKDFAAVDAYFMRKGFVRDKETAMPNGAKDGDAPEEMGYIHPKTGVFYEIHTRLFSTESSAYGYLNRAFSDVFAHPSKVEVQGQSIFTLEETHHLFYLLCHSFKHFLHGGVGIRQICDMVQMIRVYGRKIDWEMFWQLCEEYHMTCFCINLLDIGERYLGFSYEASGAVRAAKKLHPDSEALLIDILDAGSFGKSSAGRIHSANITLYAAETGAEKHTAGGIWKSLVPEASYMKNKYPYAARYPFLLPAAYVQRILKWLGQGEKEQKSSIEVGAGRVELLKKYDMIRTADWKKRGDAHAGRIQREK